MSHLQDPGYHCRVLHGPSAPLQQHLDVLYGTDQVFLDPDPSLTTTISPTSSREHTASNVAGRRLSSL